MSLDYPIVVIHNGKQKYLNICLKQAHFSNPNTRIILIGSGNDTKDLPFVEHYNIDDYFNLAKDFEKYYKHYSCNPYSFELICIQRWFVLYEFMQKNNIERVLHIDSDVLLYSNFSKEQEYLQYINQYDYSVFLSGSIGSMHTSFINSQAILKRFYDFVVQMYRDDKFMSQLDKYHKEGVHYNLSPDVNIMNPVSDMTLWALFSNSKGVNPLGTVDIIKDTLINLNIGLYDNEYAALGQILNCVFDKSNVPYITHIKQNKNIRLHSLHFQAWKKHLMSKYCTYDLNNQHIGAIAYDEFDLQNIFSLKLKNVKKKRSFKRILANAIEIFIPSKQLRSRVRTYLLN